jgi:ribosome assembly protein RRB1
MDMEDAEAMDNEVEMDEEEMDQEPENGKAPQRKVYLPGQPMQSDEQLECDETAYVFLHQAQTGLLF